MPALTRCLICDSFSPNELMELDSLMGDPTRWPSTVWAFFDKPRGGLPASYRRFGALRVGREWLDNNGHADVAEKTLRKHLRYDVAHVATTPDDLVKVGLIRSARPSERIPDNPALDAGAVIRYFNAGVVMGEAALRLLAARINASIDAGEMPSKELVMKLADLGSKLAVAQVSAMSRGIRFNGDQEDEDDAFRGSEASGTKMGHTRVRKVDGETRPIRDEGQADREQYDKRAIEDGTGRVFD